MIATIEPNQEADIVKFQTPKQQYDFSSIPLDDPRVWAMYSRGELQGIFQCESKLVQDWARKLKPGNIEDLSCLIALVRPGGLESGMADAYCNRKNGQETTSYLHPSLEPILRKTYGTIVYQEQILEICQRIAGFTEVQADLLRRAMGKKLVDEMSKIKQVFIDGCKKTNIVPEDIANQLFDIIEKSQRYLFNKCLSPETIVETPSGLKTLEEIVIGDKVLAPKDDGTTEFVDVVNKYDNGEQEVVEVTTEDGNKIICTLSHVFLCNDGEKRQLWEIILNNHQIVTV